MRDLVKKVLSEVSKNGLPDKHHFYITFITKFKSVSVSIKTDNTLEELSKTLFPVEVSKQKVIEYLINEHLKKKGG